MTRERGVDFAVHDKPGRLGGTWWAHRRRPAPRDVCLQNRHAFPDACSDLVIDAESGIVDRIEAGCQALDQAGRGSAVPIRSTKLSA